MSLKVLNFILIKHVFVFDKQGFCINNHWQTVINKMFFFKQVNIYKEQNDESETIWVTILFVWRLGHLRIVLLDLLLTVNVNIKMAQPYFVFSTLIRKSLLIVLLECIYLTFLQGIKYKFNERFIEVYQFVFVITNFYNRLKIEQ